MDKAHHFTIQNLLNCYTKETGKGIFRKASEFHTSLGLDPGTLICEIPFPRENTMVYAPVLYKSPTGRHLFAKTVWVKRGDEQPAKLDYLQLVSMMQRELSGGQDGISLAGEELILRTILSYQNMRKGIEEREADAESFSGKERTFLESEQSLLIGHQLHPTPKSRQGMDDAEEAEYAPERRGSFQLHYFWMDGKLIEEDSALGKSASRLIKEELMNDPDVPRLIKETRCSDESGALIPIHPLQARKLLGKPEVCEQIQAGHMTYLGPLGKKFHPTSSVRTVYHPESQYMYKFSIPVKITNSLRNNLRKELDRGVEISRLLSGRIGEELTGAFPHFSIIRDPAYINMKGSGSETGFEVVIRENPFGNGHEERTALIASLTQDGVYGEQSHLSRIINGIAREEEISTEDASEEWFKRYLAISLRPMYWLYSRYGIALEAHMQNAVVKMDRRGYPSDFFYRDNQGYYFMESKQHLLSGMVPNFNQKSGTVCGDEIAEERFRYYVFFNHMFGLVNAFGAGGLISEERLLLLLRKELELLLHTYGDHTNLIQSLLSETKLPCKANLLTRMKDMDELSGSLAEQSVYIHTSNPLMLAGERHEV